MEMGAITAASTAAATPVRALSAIEVKLALTLLADTDRSLSGSGAPAAPRSPVHPAVPLAPGLDFPALIARFAMAPRPPRSSRSDRRSRKRD
jgi:hypothetical protein